MYAAQNKCRYNILKAGYWKLELGLSKSRYSAQGNG
jgi:hypothetical protein